MIAATLFSGIGAPEVAMPHWHWAWHAEIERFPNAVMKEKHPRSHNLGDVTSGDFIERAEDIARPDVLVFGSPCQSFSVAGKRVGLDDPRGNLAIVALGIVARLKPRWFVFENVPGLLSSSEGRDFGLFLRTVDELGYFGAWASLDAQWFGVAQRRERLFFVGNSRDWRYSAAVLFESESLLGHSPPRRQAREGIAPTIASHPTGGGGLGTDFDCDGGLIANAVAGTLGMRSAAHPSGTKAEADFMVPDIAWALQERDAKGVDSDTKDGHLIVAKSVKARPWNSHREDSDTYVTHALRADGFDASEDGTGRGTPPIAHSLNSTHSATEDGTGRGIPLVADTVRSHPRPGSNSVGNIAVAPKPIGSFQQSSMDGRGTLGWSDDGEAPLRPIKPQPDHQFVAFDAPQSDVCVYGDLAAPLDTDGHTQALIGFQSNAGSHGGDIHENLAPTLRVQGGRGGTSVIAFSSKDHGADAADEIAPTLRAMGHDGSHANAGGQVAVAIPFQSVADPIVARSSRGGGQTNSPGYNADGNLVFAAHMTHAVAFHENQRAETTTSETAGSLKVGGGKPGQGYPAVAIDMQSNKGLHGGGLAENVSPPHCTNGAHAVHQSYSMVRRLTPRECERLQGFPDDYTLVNYRGKPAADGPRYKALGNSMAVPVIRWILSRIELVDGVNLSAATVTQT